MPNAHDPATLEFYDREAADYVARSQQVPSRHLAGFMARLPAGGEVLELGCGAGRDALAMIAAGFRVDATDASPAMARQAKALIGQPVRVMRFDALRAEAAYDGIYANASLLHVPRAELGVVLSHLHRALRPGGWHLATYKAGLAEGRDRWGRFFNYPDEEILRAVYQAAGFRVEALTACVGGGYGGVREAWLAVTVQR